MKEFAQLFKALDETTKTNAKVEALASYFNVAADQDKLWVIAMLSGKRPRRAITTTMLRQWAAEAAQLPPWLFESSYAIVGDLAETIALVLPAPGRSSNQNLSTWIDFIQALKDLDELTKKQRVLEAWDQLIPWERFIFNKLITGGFRVGVSEKLMVKALAKTTGITENQLFHRLMGNWTPSDTSFQNLVLEQRPGEDLSKPYPFYLAYALEKEPHTLGLTTDWIAERKWDGIRAQLIVRRGELFIWSRGEELVTQAFPEFQELTNLLPDGTVIDGEILVFKDAHPQSFQLLQKRIGRKKVSKKLLEDAPVALFAYDLLEFQGKDIRSESMEARRTLLEEVLATTRESDILYLSPVVSFESWEELVSERAKSRENFCEGLMLKRKNSPYKVGRKKGDWWKWKIDPFVVDAVLLYAQAGHGRRANLYTAYTFAVWDQGRLVPFTKAYSGLTDEEFVQISSFVRKNTIDRFGPVRAVKPELVFEIAFEGIHASSRHKSGVALRFPRMSRWRKDKPAKEANTLSDLLVMLDAYG